MPYPSSAAAVATRAADDELFPAWSNGGTRIADPEIDNGKPAGHPQVMNVCVVNADGSGRRKLLTTDTPVCR